MLILLLILLNFWLIWAVGAVVVAFNLFQGYIDGVRFSFPLLLWHPHVILNHPSFGHAIGAAETIESGEKLAVVEFESGMMQRMAGCAVHNGIAGEIFAVMYEDRPEVDENEESNVGHFLKRKNEREKMVWKWLQKSVYWMKGMAGKRSGHNPLVMRFMQMLINERMVQVTVNPVDAEIGE